MSQIADQKLRASYLGFTYFQKTAMRINAWGN